MRQEIAIQGSFGYTHANFGRAIELLEQGVVSPSPAWVEQRPLHDGGAAFAGLVDGSITIPKIILRPATAF